jgi:membrane associated rhomboid family serine protease
MRYSYRGATPVWILIGLNVFVYFLELLFPGSVYTNLAVNSVTFAQQPWTILTSMFIHSRSDYTHILFNMLTLYFFGTFLLQLIEDKWFWAVYFIGGIAGNFLFMVLAPGETALGASGAIYALGGAMLVLRPNLRVLFFVFPMPLWIAIIIGFLLTLSAGVAWQAHLGGLVVGLIAGYYFRRRERRTSFPRWS